MIHTITIETDNYYHVLAVTAFAHRLGLSTHVTHSTKITKEEQQAAFRRFVGSWEGDETAEEIEAIIDGTQDDAVEKSI
jgi:hypothetical protein